uniref:Uncharacterized protein n=1 Tax=Noctiluca scintillans TaxID=2966 RepID=A0A7S1AJF5_NOCSC
MGCARSSAVRFLDTEEDAQEKTKASTSVLQKIDQSRTTYRLNLRESALTELPQAALDARTANLKIVILSFNSLQRLPDAIRTWQGVRSLSVSHNLLTELPSAIGSLVNLEQLEAYHNYLTSLPQLSGLVHLKVLTLHSNRLGPVLPDVFHGMKSLSEVDLSRNEIQELSPSLSSVTCLVRLDLYSNHLQELPGSLGGLSNLVHLDVSSNQLKALPPEFFQGTLLLAELWLKGNPIDRAALLNTPGFLAFTDRQQRSTKDGGPRVALKICGLW